VTKPARPTVAMNRDLICRGDLSDAELSGRSPRTNLEKPDANMRPVQASPLSVWRDPWSCQRDIDCQRLSATMARTVCPVHSPVTESDRPVCKGLDMRKVWKSTTYQMDATPVASKPMSAASAHFERTLLIGSSN